MSYDQQEPYDSSNAWYPPLPHRTSGSSAAQFASAVGGVPHLHEPYFPPSVPSPALSSSLSVGDRYAQDVYPSDALDSYFVSTNAAAAAPDGGVRSAFATRWPGDLAPPPAQEASHLARGDSFMSAASSFGGGGGGGVKGHGGGDGSGGTLGGVESEKMPSPSDSTRHVLPWSGGDGAEGLGGNNGSGMGLGNSNSNGEEAPGRVRAAEPGWKRFLPGSLTTRIYVGIVLLQTLVDMAIEANLLQQFLSLKKVVITAGNSNMDLRLPVQLGIFGLAHGFLLLMALDAVKARNSLQIFGLCVFNFMFLVYAIFQIAEIKESFSALGAQDAQAARIPYMVLTSIIPAMIGASEAGYLVLSWYIYREFGWDVYKALGADRRLKKMFLHYQIFICVLKFSLFFFLGFSIQLIYLVLKRDWEFYLTVVALPISVLILVLGWYSARRESRLGMTVLVVAEIILAVYYVFKTIRIWQGETKQQLETIYKSLTVFSALSLGVLLALTIMTCLVWADFGKGLKEGLDRKQLLDKEKRRGGLRRNENIGYPLGSKAINRMSIN